MWQTFASVLSIGLALFVITRIYVNAVSVRSWRPITKVTPRRVDQLFKRADTVNNSFYLPPEVVDCAEYAREFALTASSLHSEGLSADATLYANLASASLNWVEAFQAEGLAESLDAIASTKELNRGLRLIQGNTINQAQIFFQNLADEDAHPDYKRVAVVARQLIANQQSTTEAWSVL